MAGEPVSGQRRQAPTIGSRHLVRTCSYGRCDQWITACSEVSVSAQPYKLQVVIRRRPDRLRCHGYRRSAFRAHICDYFRARATRGISGLQVPAALRPNGTLGEHERLVRIGATLCMFADDAVHDAALAVRPLDASRSPASAAEAEPFFRGTTLSRYFHESGINHDAVFRERDRAVRQNNPNQTRTRFASPAGTKDRRFCHVTT